MLFILCYFISSLLLSFLLFTPLHNALCYSYFYYAFPTEISNFTIHTMAALAVLSVLATTSVLPVVVLLWVKSKGATTKMLFETDFLWAFHATPLRVKNNNHTKTITQGVPALLSVCGPKRLARPLRTNNVCSQPRTMIFAHREGACGLTDGPVRPYAAEMPDENGHKHATTP